MAASVIDRIVTVSLLFRIEIALNDYLGIRGFVR